MNELDINQALILDESINLLYNGILSSNELKLVDKNRESIYIVNIDPSHMPGSHWVVIYVNTNYCEFFDSLGNEPSTYNKHFKDFISNYEMITFSKNKLQSKTSTKCGMYCIYYCYYKARGHNLIQIVNTFSTDQKCNDNMMDAFMRWYNGQVA